MNDRPPFAESYRVRPGLLAGRYPWAERGEVAALVKVGVRLFLDLTESGELAPYAPWLPPGIDYRRMPIRNFGVTTPSAMCAILDLLDACLADGRLVYLHCWGGLGRTGTVVGCHLVRHGMDGDAALAEIRHLRLADGCDPGNPSPETDAQRAMVREWTPGR